MIYTDASGNQSTLSPSVYSLAFTAAVTGSLWGIGVGLTYPLTGIPIASGTSLTLNRVFPLQQLTSISNQGDFAPQNIEAMGDIEEMQLQQIAARTGQQRGVWATGVQYNSWDVVIDGANGANTGNYYSCVIPNVSGTWSADLAAGDWSLAINVQIIAGYATSAAASASTATTEAGIATTEAGISTTAAGTATTEAGIATTQAGIATTAATQASNYAASYSGTSTTANTVGTGAKTFTTQASKLWVNGQYLQIASNASALNYMHGTVTSYNGTTLTMNITDIGGSGSHSDWNISISGTQGPIGPSGSVGTTGSPVSGNLTKFSGTTSITNADLTGDVTTSGGVTTTIATNAVITSKINANAVTNAKMATSSINSLAGYDNSGNFSDVTAGTGLSLVSGTLSVTSISAVTAFQVIDATDITLSMTPTQANVGTTLSINIPVHGFIELSFYGKLIASSLAPRFDIGIRIGGSNYYSLGYIAGAYINYFNGNAGGNAYTALLQGGGGTGDGTGFLCAPVRLPIEALGIPTGLQTVQPIASYSGSTSGLTIKGTDIPSQFNVVVTST